jgi:hypothetical protein
LGDCCAFGSTAIGVFAFVIFLNEVNVNKIGTSSIDWAQLSRFYLRRCVLENKQDGVLDKDRMMENVQKRNI